MPERLFVYGTLLFDEVLERVVGRTFERVPAHLPGYERWCVQGRAYPGLIRARFPAADTFVLGDVFLDVDMASLDLIDAYEDTFYEQRRVTVITGTGSVEEALAYVISDNDCHRLTCEPWHPEEFRKGSLREFILSLAPLAALVSRQHVRRD